MSLTFAAPLEGSTWSGEGYFNRTHTRKVRATGFVATDPDAMMAELLADPGFPSHGDALGGSFTGLHFRGWSLDRIVCRQETQRSIFVWFQYQQVVATTTAGIDTPDDDGAVVVRTRTILKDIETDFDRNDDQMQLTHDGITVPVRERDTRYLTLIECSRLEETSSRVRNETYAGKLNSATWNGYAARTVLCEDIQDDTRDNGQTFDVRYAFVYDPLGHDPTRTFTLPDGSPVADPDSSARKTFEIKDEVSFAALAITLP